MGMHGTCIGSVWEALIVLVLYGPCMGVHRDYIGIHGNCSGTCIGSGMEVACDFSGKLMGTV